MWSTIIFPICGSLAAYLVGAVNFSIVAARLTNAPDPRTVGSKNAGATNLARTVGWTVGGTIIGLEVARGALVTLLLARLPFDTYWPFCALFLLVGNLFPLFHGFRGGKGVATSVGIIMALNPTALLLGLGIFFAVLGIWKKMSLASLALFTTSTLILIFTSAPLPITIAAATITAVLFWTHRANIRRIRQGKEPGIFGPKV